MNRGSPLVMFYRWSKYFTNYNIIAHTPPHTHFPITHSDWKDISILTALHCFHAKAIERRIILRKKVVVSRFTTHTHAYIPH